MSDENEKALEALYRGNLDPDKYYGERTYNVHDRGWNACLDHLRAQGYFRAALETPKPSGGDSVRVVREALEVAHLFLSSKDGCNADHWYANALAACEDLISRSALAETLESLRGHRYGYPWLDEDEEDTRDIVEKTLNATIKAVKGEG